VLKLRLATTESYLDRNNTRQERTEWHRITIWGKRGEALAKFLAKGDRLFIEGRIQTSSYEKNGEKRYSTDIIANNVILAGGGRRGGTESDQPRSSNRSAPPTSRNDDGPAPSYDAPSDDFGGGGGGGGGGDDEIPF
jgi:single-strand DNA-binding protein